MYRQQFYILANILMLLDGLICIAGGYSAFMISIELRSHSLIMGWNDMIGSILLVMFVNNFVMGRFGFYSEKRFSSYPAMIWGLFLVASLDLLILSIAAVFAGMTPFSRIFVVSYFAILLTGFSITRIVLYLYLDRRAPSAFNSRQILIVGTKARIEPVVKALEQQRSWGHQVVGCLDVDGGCSPDSIKIPVLGHISGFEEILLDRQIDEVIFAVPGKFPIDLKAYIQKCEKIGVAFRIVPGMYDIEHPRLRVEALQTIPTLVGYSWAASASGLLYKRVLDLVAGLAGFLVFMILYPIIGLAIKIESPGPVLFKQRRIGLHGREFYLYKFRSMESDAESRKADLLVDKNVPWPIYKTEQDPRVTKSGAFLRNTSLDELPQFINVLKGEMSLVGTRPPTPEEVRHYEDWHRRRISIKPGITGLWQISGRKEIKDFAEVVKLDLQYIDGWRFQHDLIILWKTLWAVLTRRGAQ